MGNGYIFKSKKTTILTMMSLIALVAVFCFAALFFGGCDDKTQNQGDISDVKFVYNDNEYNFAKVGDTFIKDEVVDSEDFLYWYFLDGENEVAITDENNVISVDFYNYISDKLGEGGLTIECFPKFTNARMVVISVDGIVGTTFNVEKSVPVAKLDAVSKAGYTFEGYSLTAGGDKVFDKDGKALKEVVFESNTTIYPLFTAIKYSFAFNTGEGEVKTMNFTFGSQLSNFVFPEKEGYNFKGWYLSEQYLDAEKVCDESCKFIAGKEILNETYLEYANADAIINLYAKWEIKKLEVTFYGDNQVFKTLEFDYFTDSIPALSELPISVGKNFEGWKYNDKMFAAGVDITIDGGLKQNIRIYAQFSNISYSLSVYKESGVTFNNSAIAENATYDVSLASIQLNSKAFAEKSYYKFKGWRLKDFDNDKNTSQTSSITREVIMEYLKANVSGNNTIYIEPVFEAIEYKVEYVIADGSVWNGDLTAEILNGNPTAITAEDKIVFRDLKLDYIKSVYTLGDETSVISSVSEIFTDYTPTIGEDNWITLYVKTSYYDYEFVYTPVVLDSVNKKVYSDVKMDAFVGDHYFGSSFDFTDSIALGDPANSAVEVIFPDMSAGLNADRFVFKGWSFTSPVSYDASYQTIEESKASVDSLKNRQWNDRKIYMYAIYEPKTYTLTYDYSKVYVGSEVTEVGEIDGFEEMYYRYDDLVKKVSINYYSSITQNDMPVPQLMWYKFTKWVDVNGNQVFTLSKKSSDITLCPQFSVAEFKVNYNFVVGDNKVTTIEGDTKFRYTDDIALQVPGVIGYNNVSIDLYGDVININSFDAQNVKNLTAEKYFDNITDYTINLIVNTEYIQYKITYMKPVFNESTGETDYHVEITEDIGNPKTYTVADKNNSNMFAEYDSAYEFIAWYILTGDNSVKTEVRSIKDLIYYDSYGDKTVYAELNPFDFDLKYQSIGNGKGEFTWTPPSSILSKYELTVGSKTVTIQFSDSKGGKVSVYEVDELTFFDCDEYVSTDDDPQIILKGYSGNTVVSSSTISHLKRLSKTNNVRVENDTIKCDVLPVGQKVKVFVDGVRIDGTSLAVVSDGSHVVTVQASYSPLGSSTVYIDSVPVQINVYKIDKPTIAFENNQLVVKNALSGIDYTFYNNGKQFSNVNDLPSGIVNLTAVGNAKYANDCYYLTSSSSDTLTKNIIKVDASEFVVSSVPLSSNRFNITIRKSGTTADITMKIRWLDDSNNEVRESSVKTLTYDEKLKLYCYEKDHYLGNQNVTYVEFSLTIQDSAEGVEYLTGTFLYKVEYTSTSYVFTKVN